MEREPEDDVADWPAGAGAAPAARRGRDVVRIGRLAIPVAALAWGISVSAHAGLVLVGVAVWRYSRPNSPPSVRFAQGDGGTEFGVYRPGGEGVTWASPVNASQQDDGPPHAAPVLDDALDDAVTFPNSDPVSLAEDSEPALVGIPTSDVPVAPLRPAAAPESGNGDGTATGVGNEGSPGVASGVGAAHLPAPVYPRESRRNGEQGTVVVEVDVGTDGSPSGVRVVDDAGFPRLGAAAVEAVKKARFTPALRDGTPVAASVRIPFVFTLRSGSAARPHT